MSLYFKIKNKRHPNGQHAYTPQYRIATTAKDENNSDALAMRIADPLWMLGRQWQMGEFLGEDNGSPIQVKINAKKEHLNQYAFQEKKNNKLVWGDKSIALDSIPPEVVVERMELQIHSLREKVRIGQALEQLIKDNNKDDLDLNLDGWAQPMKTIPALRKAYELSNTRWKGKELPISIDEKSTRFLKLMQGKVIDGGKIMETISALKLEIPKLKPIFDELEIWYKALFSQPTTNDTKDNSSWSAHELVHKFQLSSEDEKKKIDAPDYQSGHLDWYSFDKSEMSNLPSSKKS